jgi:hypothetical protein
VTWAELLVVDAAAGPIDHAAALWDAALTLTVAGLLPASLQAVAGPRSVVAEGVTEAGARVHLSYVQGAHYRPRFTLKAFGPSGSLAATAGDPAVADPGGVWRVDADGVTALPTDYQPPRRVALAEVRAVVAQGLTPPCLLAGFAAAARVVRDTAWSGRPGDPHPIRKEIPR